MSKLQEGNTVIVSRESLSGQAGGTTKEVFLATGEEFGGLMIMHTLLLHEHKLRNNLNASRFLGRMLDMDYDNACRRAGTIINRLNGGNRRFVTYNQINRIKAGIAQVYAMMDQSNIELTDTGFKFHEAKTPEIEIEDD